MYVRVATSCGISDVRLQLNYHSISTTLMRLMSRSLATFSGRRTRTRPSTLLSSRSVDIRYVYYFHPLIFTETKPRTSVRRPERVWVWCCIPFGIQVWFCLRRQRPSYLPT